MSVYRRVHRFCCRTISSDLVNMPNHHSYTQPALLAVSKSLFVYVYNVCWWTSNLLNFTRSWGFGIFRVYWVSKSKCIISSNLRAEGSWGKALNVVIFVESVVHRSNWRSRETETVGNSRKQSETARRDHAKIVNPPFFCKKNCRIKGTSPNCFQLFPVALSKKKWDCAESFFCKKMADWQFWHDHAGPLPTVSDCFRLFPTVSVSLERQLDLWTTDSTKITTFNAFPHDPSARRLLEMMHFDFETQYTLKIPKPQDLVKFNNLIAGGFCKFFMNPNITGLFHRISHTIHLMQLECTCK